MIPARYRAVILFAGVLAAWLTSSLMPVMVPVMTALVVVLGYCLFGMVEAMAWDAHRRGMARLAAAGHVRGRRD